MLWLRRRFATIENLALDLSRSRSTTESDRKYLDDPSGWSVLVEDPTRIFVAAVRRRARRRDSPKSSPRQISTSTFHSDHYVYTTTTTITTIILALYYLITATITTITTVTTTATTTTPVLERTCTRCPGKRWPVELFGRGKFKGHKRGREYDGNFRKLSRRIDRDSHETIIYYSHYIRTAHPHGAHNLISRNTNPGLVEIWWMFLGFFYCVFF